jgi:cyclopropane fatty-acyl-phospholipid synthase-like methyltransferase
MPNSDHPPRPVVVEERSRAADARQYSPSAARNREPILEVMTRVLAEQGIVLEIGSGTGEHAVYFAKALPRFVWLPSDPDEAARASIEAWITTEGLANVLAPVPIDVREAVWGAEDAGPFDAMISLNMVQSHLGRRLSGSLPARRLLGPDGVLFLYGPFMLDGTHTAASNAAFDADLKRRDPRWGVRDVDDLVREGALRGLELREIVKMPANNLSLVFVKATPTIAI